KEPPHVVLRRGRDPRQLSTLDPLVEVALDVLHGLVEPVQHLDLLPLLFHARRSPRGPARSCMPDSVRWLGRCIHAAQPRRTPALPGGLHRPGHGAARVAQSRPESRAIVRKSAEWSRSPSPFARAAAMSCAAAAATGITTPASRAAVVTMPRSLWCRSSRNPGVNERRRISSALCSMIAERA